LLDQVLAGQGIVTKWSALAIKVLLTAHKSVSKPGYSAATIAAREVWLVDAGIFTPALPG
jgi:hypothetical protein